MVLERLVSVREAVREPAWMFVIGGIIATVCLLISFLIFPSSVGLMTTFLVTMASMPFMLNLASYEEAREEQTVRDVEITSSFEIHKPIIKIYIAFFGGMIFAFSIIFMILPENIVFKLFEDQINEIRIIRGEFLGLGHFGTILVNNIGVLFITFLFSFLFGAGAVFILTWNASVLATAIGLSAKSLGGIHALPMAVLTYFPHGSLELLAYFIGGIAGSLVSVALSKRRTRRLNLIIKDSSYLMIIAIVFLIIAAFIESVSLSLA